MSGGRLRLAVFALLCVAQLAFAGSLIWRAEAARHAGRVWRFRTAPVDPADLVRGRYVALAFRATSGPPRGPAPLERGDTAHAHLAEDAEGFARVTGVSARRPEGDDHLTVEVTRVGKDRVWFELPVRRLYLPEALAPEAEDLYRRSPGRAWAEIRVHEGRAALLDVYLDGEPLAEAARAALEAQEAAP